MLFHERERARTSPTRRSRRPVLEPLEERMLLSGNPPFAVGGDPIVNPADFRVTTFASGLNYPHGMTTLSDGSLLVGVNNPVGGTSFFNTVGQLLRFTDTNSNGLADGAGQVVFGNLPGEVTALHQAGEFILATTSEAGSERISFLRSGATPSAALTPVGSIDFSFPAGWEHTTFAFVVRPTPGQSGNYDVIINIGSQYNGVVIGNNGRVVLDANGNPTFQPTTGTVGASGLVSGTLQCDSLYMVTVHDNLGSPDVSNLGKRHALPAPTPRGGPKGTFLLLPALSAYWAILHSSGSGRRARLVAAGAEAVLQAQQRGGLRGPGAGAVGTIAAEREPDGGDLGFGHRGVDELQPVGPARDRPRIEGRPRVPGSEARPWPNRRRPRSREHSNPDRSHERSLGPRTGRETSASLRHRAPGGRTRRGRPGTPGRIASRSSPAAGGLCPGPLVQGQLDPRRVLAEHGGGRAVDVELPVERRERGEVVDPLDPR